MSIWVLRGLRDGIVTTRWPRRPDEYADSWRGPVTVSSDVVTSDAVAADGGELEWLCPTGAIEVIGGLPGTHTSTGTDPATPESRSLSSPPLTASTPTAMTTFGSGMPS